MSLNDATLANLASRIQFKKATVMLVEPNTNGLEVLTQVFMGLGATRFLKASTYDEACSQVRTEPVDLILCEATLQPGDKDGYDFVSWLRRANLQPNSYAPTIITTAHTSRRNVDKARDCGAHFVLMKPLAPSVVIDRVVWIAQANRGFVACNSYVGPDRRFHNLGPPGGVARRSTDLSVVVGEAQEPNMSQDEIDNLVVPQKAIS